MRRLVPLALVLIVTAGARGPSNDDAAIMRHLRPAQRTNVVVVTRAGDVRTLAFEETTAPLEVAETRPRPLPNPAHPLPEVAAVHVVHVAPPSVRPRPPLSVALVRDHTYALRDGTPFVPTIRLAKPRVFPTLPPNAHDHDLAWMYAHRFSTGGTGVPGVQVRSQVSSPFDTDSGAFHGVRAQNGWSAVRVAVSIPCGVRHFVTGPGYNEVTGRPGIVDQETGYIYIGGWGAGPGGVSVDAGLQKSSAQAEHDDYAFYWKYAGNKPITSDARFPCGGPDVELELYPVSDSLLVFSVTGVTNAGERHTLTVVQQTRPGDGWIPAGGSRNDGVILKRIVSIAQPWTWHRRSGVGKSDRFVSGSYFGVAGPNDLRPRIVWRACEVGRVDPPAIVPQYRGWTSSETWYSNVPGIYTDWPPLGVFQRSDGVCDATGIYLHA